VAGEPAKLNEYQVKGAYLFNFAKYVEWPTNALLADNSPIIIGVIDGNAAAPVIKQVVANKLVNEHPLVVKVMATPDPMERCHILFVSRAAKISPAEVRAMLGTAATLVVGETESFAEEGGMVGFVLEGDTLRVNLNLETLACTDLKVSAKLASVARIVKTRSPK